MNRPQSDIIVNTLTAYSFEDAAAIGRLLPFLSDSFSGEPVDRQLLTDIIASPYHDQLVARSTDGTIVGALTISLTMGAGVIRKAWLEDFVVDPAIQGGGVGGKLWDAMIDWCRTRGVHKLDFTSHPTKEAAQRFYLKRGAVVRDTNYFRKTID